MDLSGLPEEEAVQTLAGIAGNRQQRAVDAFLDRSPSLTPYQVKEELLVLLATEFREGINLTLETYGLKEREDGKL